MRNFINLVEAALVEAAKLRPTAEDLAAIRQEREEIRAAEGGGGMCHFVSEWIMDHYGWTKEGGTVTAPNGDVVCSAHRWNILPDGAILDATADQFGQGHDILIIPKDSPLHACYRYEWDDDHNPRNHNGHAGTAAHADAWSGEMDWDHDIRLRKERGNHWNVTDKAQHASYQAQQRAYATAKGERWSD